MQIMIGRTACRLALTVLASGLASYVSAAGFKELMNEEYRFSVDVPADMVSCEVASGGHLHGFSILLDPRREGCASKAPQPYIGFFGDYNVLESRSSKAAMRLLCDEKNNKQYPVHGVLLAFPGYESTVCEKDDAGGWVDVFVTAQKGNWPDAPSLNPYIPYINYTAELHTTRIRFVADVKKFKELLGNFSLR